MSEDLRPRTRWISRADFLALIADRQADPALTAELAELTRDESGDR